MFVPPLNLGGFQPSPATLAQWVYQIWQYLQENPIATQEQIQEYIGTFIKTSPETQAMIGAGVEEYLTDNPPTAPVQSVQGKTGAVQLAYNEIVPASNAVPVYKASSTPNTNTLVGQYNLGYRLFVNTATQEIFTISPAGALSLVGRGKFDGTTIDLNTAQGDTTISEAVTAVESSIGTLNTNISGIQTRMTQAETDINTNESNIQSVNTALTSYKNSVPLKSGDTFVINNRVMLCGMVSGSSKSLWFTLSLGRKITANNVRLTTLSATLRGPSGYIDGSGAHNLLASQYESQAYIADYNGGLISISVTKSTEFTGATNNTPIVVDISTSGLKLNFS